MEFTQNKLLNIDPSILGQDKSLEFEVTLVIDVEGTVEKDIPDSNFVGQCSCFKFSPSRPLSSVEIIRYVELAEKSLKAMQLLQPKAFIPAKNFSPETNTERPVVSNLVIKISIRHR